MHRTLLALAAIVLLTATGCHKQSPSPAPAAKAVATPRIGGEPVVQLTRRQSGDAPQFLGVTLLPGRGLNVFQITAWLPGRGNIHVLASPSLQIAAQALTGKGPDHNGDNSYTFGGAFLIPYPNRIFGKVSPDQDTVTTSWRGQKIVLPANVRYGRNPSDRDAMHGLILKSKIQNIQVTTTPDGQTLTGILHAGNFGGHWLSSTDLHFTVALTGPAIDVSITATNVGAQPEPMAIGWHPYFSIPSGQRAQARLSVPATMRTLVNNYQVEKPTGKLQPVQGTPYDFNTPNGKPLGNLYLDDGFSHLLRSNGGVAVQITDPASHYGIEEIGLSPAIRSVQIYSPSNARFVAIEQQYNLVDPFGPEWHGRNTGMVDLKPGQSTTWHVRLHLFTPKN
jgi:galactose mutarotase-like enzyme